jgi:hypothetical protein
MFLIITVANCWFEFVVSCWSFWTCCLLTYNRDSWASGSRIADFNHF